jgi:hypothetical protein
LSRCVTVDGKRRVTNTNFIAEPPDSTLEVQRNGGEELYPRRFLHGRKLTVMDLAGKDLLSVSVTNDKALRRPRPLMMTADPGGVRLYNGRDYVIIAAP